MNCPVKCDHGSECMLRQQFHNAHHMRDECYVLEWGNGTIEKIKVSGLLAEGYTEFHRI